MGAWRMAMRGWYHDGKMLERPREMWARCVELGVAAITYEEVQDDDFAEYTPEHLPDGWTRLSSPRKYSLRSFVYNMQPGDVIYVKRGPEIVGKGIILGNYYFDRTGTLVNDLGVRWRHQRKVDWDPNFGTRRIRIGNNQRFRVNLLTPTDVTAVERTKPGR